MKTNVEISLTPEDLAQTFIHWGSDEQAAFLNLVGKAFRGSDFDAEMQCCYLAKDVDKNGRDFLYTVANFVKVRGVPCGSPKERILINSYPGDSLR